MAKTETAVYLPEDLGQEPQPSKKRRILKLLLVLLLIAVLVVGGFFLGIYLRIFDTNAINEKMGLYNLPLIGQFFVKPVPKNSDTEDNSDLGPSQTKVEDVKPTTDDKTSRPVVLTKAEIEKQMKAKQAEEKKRISKLARLYNEMKPAEAAGIMDTLDDDTTIAILQRMDESQAAKILAQFDPGKSGRITKVMFNGLTPKPQNTNAQQQNGQSNQTAQQPNP